MSPSAASTGRAETSERSRKSKVKTPPDRTIVFTLYSHPAKDPALRWKATLAFLPGSTDESFAELAVVDSEGRPVPKGVLDFAGAHIAVKNGEGKLRCADFVKGKHEGGVWFRRPGVVPVPGALTFE